MFGAIHVDNAWLTARVQEILTKSGITVAQVVSPTSCTERPFPSIGRSFEKNGSTIRPVFITAFDELWVFLPYEGHEPLIILPGEFVADSELTALVK
jgi:hypothetical protein